MLICPDCHNEVINATCAACDWQLTDYHGIPSFLSKLDSSDLTFQKYLKNYDVISIDDLTESLQNLDYLNLHTKKFYSYLGNVKNSHVCEVGIGRGTLFDMLIQSRPKSLVGIDISIPYLNKYKNITDEGQKVNVIQANAENIPYKNEFDLVVASDILEHVINVGDFLFSVNRSLKDSGLFVVKAPYDEDINVYSKYAGCKYDYVHLRNFTKKSLKTTLTGAGFEIIKYHFDGFYSYKKRRLFRSNRYINYLFEKCMQLKYKNVHHVTNINNFFGKILMKPIVITAICRKTSEAINA